MTKGTGTKTMLKQTRGTRATRISCLNVIIAASVLWLCHCRVQGFATHYNHASPWRTSTHFHKTCEYPFRPVVLFAKRSNKSIKQSLRSKRKKSVVNPNEQEDAAFSDWLAEKSKQVTDPHYHVDKEHDSVIYNVHEKESLQFHHATHPAPSKSPDIATQFSTISRKSFENVQGTTDQLLSKKPLLAIGVFVAVSLMVAYVVGFFFLDGYISSPNPFENAQVPYFDDSVVEESPPNFIEERLQSL